VVRARAPRYRPSNESSLRPKYRADRPTDARSCGLRYRSRTLSGIYKSRSMGHRADDAMGKRKSAPGNRECRHGPSVNHSSLARLASSGQVSLLARATRALRQVMSQLTDHAIASLETATARCSTIVRNKLCHVTRAGSFGFPPSTEVGRPRDAGVHQRKREGRGRRVERERESERAREREREREVSARGARDLLVYCT